MSAVMQPPRTGSLGSNIEYAQQGDILTIRIDLSKRFGRSGSGKSTIVATTSGNRALDGTPVTIGINAYVKD